MNRLDHAAVVPDKPSQVDAALRREGSPQLGELMNKLLIVAIALLAPPALAQTPENAALARELLVCAGKFGGLALLGQGSPGAESRMFYEAATNLAGADFVKREAPAANERAADWVFAKDADPPTLEKARAACLPLLEQARK